MAIKKSALQQKKDDEEDQKKQRKRGVKAGRVRAFVKGSANG